MADNDLNDWQDVGTDDWHDIPVAEPATMAHETPSVNKEPFFEAGPLRIEKNPLDVNWLQAAGDKINETNPDWEANKQNPLFVDAAAPAISQGLSKVGQFIKSGAQMAATTPKIQQAISTITPSNWIGGSSIARGGAYLTPGINKLQLGADVASAGVKAGQNGLSYILDHSPEMLGRFVGTLKEAASHGPAALATTDFILSQTNPEYQKTKKNLHDQ